MQSLLVLKRKKEAESDDLPVRTTRPRNSDSGIDMYNSGSSSSMEIARNSRDFNAAMSPPSWPGSGLCDMDAPIVHDLTDAESLSTQRGSINVAQS